MDCIAVSSIKNGSEFPKIILKDNGQALFLSSLTATDDIISRLKNDGISFLYTDNDSFNNKSNTLILDMMQSSINLIRSHMKFLSQLSNEPLSSYYDTELIFNTYKDIISYIISKPYVLENMMLIKNSDLCTYNHSINVAIISMSIAIYMRLPKEQILELYIGALLHDIGKNFVNKDILNKRGQLTKKEFDIMKKHTIDGYQYIRNIDSISSESKYIVLLHHEKIDGSGYPFSKKGKDFDILSKIVAVSDVFDALTSNRPYRKALKITDAVEYILSKVGTQFDESIVQSFMGILFPFAEGTHLYLGDDEIAVLKDVSKEPDLRPKADIIKSSSKGSINKRIDILSYIEDLSPKTNELRKTL